MKANEFPRIRSRAFPPGHEVFEAHCGRDGTRIHGKQRQDSSEREAVYRRMEAIRSRLRAVAGSEDDLDITIRVACGESPSEIGNDYGISRWTVKRRSARTMALLKVRGLNWFLDDRQPPPAGMLVAV